MQLNAKTSGLSVAATNDVKQTTFSTLTKPSLTFGGSRLGPNTHAKKPRPLDSKLPLHIVLKAERSVMRTPKNFLRVNELVKRTIKRHGLRLYAYANVGNHLHLLVKLPRRGAWARFIRALTGRVTQSLGVKWRHRPFTRVVAGWRRAYKIVKEYVVLNQWEAEGLVSRKDTERLRELRRALS